MAERIPRRRQLKDKCKQLSIDDLKNLLDEKRRELTKRRTHQLRGLQFKAYTTEDKGKTPIREIRREIAIIQTFINQKMNNLKYTTK